MIIKFNVGDKVIINNRERARKTYGSRAPAEKYVHTITRLGYWDKLIDRIPHEDISRYYPHLTPDTPTFSYWLDGGNWFLDIELSPPAILANRRTINAKSS